METLSNIAGVSIIPVILGLVEVSKRAGIPAQFAPLISLALGVIFAFLSIGISVESFVTGLVIGLSSSGLWSGTKALMGK